MIFNLPRTKLSLSSEVLPRRSLSHFPRWEQWLPSTAPCFHPCDQQDKPLPHLKSIFLSCVIVWTMKGTWFSDEVKPLLSHLNPDYALLPQLRVDGGKLSSECVIVDHFLDKLTQLLLIKHICVCKDLTDCKFALVALCRATSAKLQNLDQDIHTELEAI